MAEYVKEFHPKLIGLTGSPEEIKRVCKDYKIYNFVPENAGESDYLVDHSVFTFLMGPKGGFLEFFGPDKTEEYMTEKVLQRMKEEEEANNPTTLTFLQRKFKQCKDIFSNFKS